MASSIPQSLAELQHLIEAAMDKPGPLVIDLRGRTLEGPLLPTSEGNLYIARQSVDIRNGHLVLPWRHGVVVSEGAQLLLHTVTVTDSSVHCHSKPEGFRVYLSGHWHGLINVHGPGTTAQLIHCSVQVQHTELSAVYVSHGASATMQQMCKLQSSGAESRSEGFFFTSGRSGHGLVVVDKGSRADIQQCHAVKCSDGFVATHRGRIKAQHCEASDNSSNGFVASCGGIMTVVSCVARHNGYGFHSRGRGSCLTVGPGSISEGNDYSGYTAAAGGCLKAADGCLALNNGINGFNTYSSKEGVSRLTAGARCSSIGNQLSGYEAYSGGQLVVGEGSIATDNGFYGFRCYGAGSRLEVRPGCSTAGNPHGEFVAEKAGELVVGRACREGERGGEPPTAVQPQAQQPTNMIAPPQQENQRPGGQREEEQPASLSAVATSTGAGAPPACQQPADGAALNAGGPAGGAPPASVAQPASAPASSSAPMQVQAGTAPPQEPAPAPARASGRAEGSVEGPATATTYTAVQGNSALQQQGNPALPGQADRHGKRGNTSQAADAGDSADQPPAQRSRRSHPGAEAQEAPPEQQIPGVDAQEQPQGRQVLGTGMALRSRAGRRAPARYSEPAPQALGAAASGRGRRSAARGAGPFHGAPWPAASSSGSATTGRAVSALLHLSSCPA